MHQRIPPAPTITALATAALLALAGCATASTPETPASQASSTQAHGAIEGASEVAEPQLHLVSLDASGQVSLLDLLEGTETALDAVEPADQVTTDGRYVFAADASGVSILDSGVWTWDHVDHFHYYRSGATTLGRLDGDGIASVATGMLSTAGTTGVFFPGSGDAVLLDNQALSDGEITETLRVTGTPHDGLAAPLGEGAVVSRSDDGTSATRLDAVGADGSTITSIACPHASGTITTRLALVIGCSDGAVLATFEGENPVLERVPYPSGDDAPATVFAARKGRPTVAGIGDGQGIWLLDTRERSWDRLETTTGVVAAAAVDDAGEHVVAIGEDGTVQVYDAGTGEQLAVTEPLLATSLADPDLAGGVSVTVDAQRAYVNAAAEGVVYEIDYADQARVARTLTMPTVPVHLAETGR
ncbi:hypothetical protein KIH74_04870 [Kineosporia sp. J2-2]|uniref:ABC transporter n=1 Tax=Kineosporia corallincola TaxID=2835133 RepID=A0ABS5TB01_9ACTN|nr:hypothetical protein [Kineosporia corallincola]MBT0768242.1 hypothetical protein [Kineosporia corallincola]